MSICVNAWIICIYLCVCVYICTCVNICTWVCLHTLSVLFCMFVLCIFCAFEDKHNYVYVCLCMCMCVCELNVGEFMCICVKWVCILCVRVNLCAHIHVDANIFDFIGVHMCLHACTCVIWMCAYVWAHVCTYVCVCEVYMCVWGRVNVVRTCNMQI